MLIRNHLLAAKPDVVGNAVIKTADTMEQGYELLNLAADKAVFNHLDKLAESHPGVTLAIGRGGLAAAGGAAIVGVGYGLATAPATTAVVIGSGVVSQKTFEAMGLSPRAAAVYSAIVVAPVAAAATTSSSMKAINSNIVGSVRGFFVGVVRFLRSEREAFTNPATGQAGHFTIGSNKKTVVIGENMDDRVVPYARENDFSYYKPRGMNRDNWLKNNRQWINRQIKQGNEIIDVGPDPMRTERSTYYQMEKSVLEKNKYPVKSIELSKERH